MYQDETQIRYVREDHPGLSWARNCGMMAAKGEILAFTDDDMIIDSYWLLELVRGFSRTDDVACVTGLILPVELETPAQFWFEEFGGYSKGYTRRIFDLKENHPKTPLYPYTTGSFGSGGNMAFTATFLRRVGGFACTLGTGTPARGAEDITAFFQVITKGYKLIYVPAAVAYHLHLRDYICLRKQIYNYGIGLTVYIMKNLFDNPFLLFDLATKIPYGFFFILSNHSPKNSKKSIHYPKELTILELQGMLYGPFAYIKSCCALRNIYKESGSVSTDAALSLAKET
jgi:GT2 family glycosyltransferase